MTSSSYTQFLLCCSTLIISAAILCNGEPVLDSDGNEVLVAGTGSTYVIQKVAEGFQGGVAKLPRSVCDGNVYESPDIIPGHSVIFTPGYPTDDPVLQVNSRTKFSFLQTSPAMAFICNDLDDWIIGDAVKNGTYNFSPILAGQPSFIDKPIRQSWFEVRSTGEKGVYKLAACHCLPCRNICPEVGSYILNGNTVLGIGRDRYFVRFVKVPSLAMKTDQK